MVLTLTIPDNYGYVVLGCCFVSIYYVWRRAGSDLAQWGERSRYVIHCLPTAALLACWPLAAHVASWRIFVLALQRDIYDSYTHLHCCYSYLPHCTASHFTQMNDSWLHDSWRPFLFLVLGCCLPPARSSRLSYPDTWEMQS